MSTKAILITSFGTSHPDTRIKTIDKIESYLRESLPDYKFYHAWTSNMIRKKLLQRDGLSIPNVTEALTQIKQDNIHEVYIQPTYVIPGMEHELLLADVAAFQDSFQVIRCGAPLLTSQVDCMTLVEHISHHFSSISSNEAIVLMGHGSVHASNHIYLSLAHAFKATGRSNIFVGTVKASPTLEDVINQLKNSSYSRAHLIPLTIVSGNHVKNDMTGNHKNSWENILIEHGFQVTCHLSGLGEYDFVRDMFLQHLKAIL